MRLYLFHATLFGHAIAPPTYGVLIALGFMVAILLGVRQSARLGEDPEKVRDLCFWLLVSSLLSARLLYVATNLGVFVDACRAQLSACTRALHVWEGGLVFYGGLLGATALAVWYTRRQRMSFWRTADTLTPMIALGHFFGRLGCFAAGCCWGAPSSLPWAVRFPPGSVVYQDQLARGLQPAGAVATAALHPVQLYEAGGELALFALLSLFATRKRYDGQVLVAYLLGYAALRFTVELVRGDAVRKFVVPGLSTSQAIALATVPLALALAARRRGSARTAG